LLLPIVRFQLCAISVIWKQLLSVLPVAVTAFMLALIPAISAALKVRFPSSTKSRVARFRLRVLTALLHLIHPLARLWSRLVYSLTACRIRRFPTLSFPWPRVFYLWSEEWIDSTAVLLSLESVLRSDGAVVHRGSEYDSWDLEIRGGLFGGVRVCTALENYGRRKHMLRLRSRPCFSISGAGTTFFLVVACFGALLDRSVYAAGILGTLSIMFGAIAFRSGAVAVGAIHRALIKLDFERM
jgi:O-antigen biosynthesis protein